MDNRSPSRNAPPYTARVGESGGVSMQMLVLMVPVFLGLSGFAVDLGRLYMGRNELKATAESMALPPLRRLRL